MSRFSIHCALLATLLGCSASESHAPAELQCTEFEADTLELSITPAREETLVFHPIQENEAIELEFGSQGSWMVSFGFRTPAPLQTEAPCEIWAELEEVGGESIADFYRSISVQTEADGTRFAARQFLVLSSSDPIFRVFDWDETDALFQVKVRDACGNELSHAVPIRLELP